MSRADCMEAGGSPMDRADSGGGGLHGPVPCPGDVGLRVAGFEVRAGACAGA